MKCPRCQQENPRHAKFCLGCGRSLSDVIVIGRPYADLQAEIDGLRRELGASVEQQTATAAILRIISNSLTDTQPVFDTIVKSAVRLCGGTACAVLTCEDDSIHVRAQVGEKPETREAVQSRFPVPLNRDSLVGRVVLDGQVVHVPDFEVAEAAPEGARTVARMVGYRSALFTPMFRDGRPIGLITVGRRDPGPFSEEEIRLMGTFADQAVIAIENVRLFKELQEKNEALTQAHAQVTEALEQQTATSEILRVISSSPTDLQPVLDAVAQKAAHICSATDATIRLLEGDTLRLVARFGSIPLGAPDVIPRSREYPSGRAVIERRTIHIDDVLPLRETEFPAISTDQRTVLATPLLREGLPSGVILIRRVEVQPFTDKQVALLQTFADQAVIAIENVRLFNELQSSNRELTTALDQQTATSEVLRTIAYAKTDPQPVFDMIVQSAARLCNAAIAAVFRTDGRKVYHPANYGSEPQVLATVRARYPRSLDMETIPGIAILTCSVVHCPDIEDLSVSEHVRQVGRLLGFRSTVGVPMVRDGEAIGALLVARREAGRFSATEVDLLKTFSDQAVIAIENVRLFTELQEKNHALTEAHAQVSEALDQQTATSEILRVISQWQTDAQPVFDAIADNVMRLFRSWAAGVYRFDGEFVHIVALRGGSPGSGQHLQEQGPYRVSRDTPIRQCFLDRSIVHIPDVDAVADMSSANREMARVRGWRALLAVPMLREGGPIGVIAVTRAEAVAFSPAEIDLLQTFADQAVIAIENVRLFTELQARTQDLTRSVGQLTALGEVGRAVSSTLDLETVLSTIVSRAIQLSGTDGGSVYEYHEATEEFSLRASRDLPEAYVEQVRDTRPRKGEGAVGRVAQTREPVQIVDISDATAYESRVRDMLLKIGLRALLAVPLIAEDRLVGALIVMRKRTGTFAAEEVALLQTFATQSALAIQNARLFRQIEDKSRQLEVASQHKSEFLANMSHELRTPLNAIIGFSEVLGERMFGELNEKQEEYLKDIYASGQHLLSLINDILDLSKIEAGRMELELTDFNLPATLDNALTLVRERAGRRGIALGLTVDERLEQIRADERKIRQVALNLLSNAIKFTPEGGRIEVRAGPVDGDVEISVSDTGVGIAPEDQEAIFEEFKQVGTAAKKVEGTGLGLALSRKFVELHGGKIWVKSQVGAGSTFTFRIPVRRRE